MDNQRIVIFFVLSFLLLMVWQYYQQETQIKSNGSTVESVEPVVKTDSNLEDLPSTSQLTTDPVSPGDKSLPLLAEASLDHGATITIRTDLLELLVDTVGGDIRQANLLAYPVAIDTPDVPFPLMENKVSRRFISQSGLLSKQESPDHHAIFKSDKIEYLMQDNQDTLVIPLYWTSPSGLQVVKSFTLSRNSYQIKIEQKVINHSKEDWSGHHYYQFQRTEPGDAEKSAFIHTFSGAVIHSKENKYEKIDFDDMRDENLNKDITGGWAVMMQHYFLAAWIPVKENIQHYYTKALKSGAYVVGVVSPQQVIKSGEAKDFSTQLYIGPKEQERLEKVAESLELTVDYGILTIIAKPIFWLLKYIHEVLHNWGWSIIVLTLMIKLMFFQLSAKSYRSMANMRRLQPKMVALKERYGNDRQKMSQAMMAMYKKEKVNPMGGCLPILVQIPVFVALYWVLLESVELRQAPFIFWLNDLSAKDPYYVLPLLMGLTMFVQQKLNPQPPDPVQAKVMMMLPVIFTLFFMFFPSGLVLYWVTNSLLSIAQQWAITRRIENAAR